MPQTITEKRKTGVAARKETIRNYTLSRNRKLSERFTHLYNVKRLRYDDVLNALELEFFISQTRIEKILRNPAI